jgi:hypothetical protein
MTDISGGNGTYPAFGSVNQVLVTNNIFVGWSIVNGTNNASGSINYSTFDHNLAYLLSGSFSQDPFAYYNNTSTNNLYNQDPKFISVANMSSPAETDNYNLQSSSPALTTASDGGQMGVYGGDPNANWSLASMPALPFIYSFLLNTVTVNTGGTINATVISKSHN